MEITSKTRFGIFPLKGALRHYDWGGYHFIPELVRHPNSQRRPCAELWLGDHPAAPSKVGLHRREMNLDTLMNVSGRTILGKQIHSKYHGRLPYLFKVLDAREMLSIQAHPNKQQAESGFNRENVLGIPLTDPRRNYRDPNPKPEMMVALSDFWMLSGFKPVEKIYATLAGSHELKPLAKLMGRKGRRSLGSTAVNGKVLLDLFKGITSLSDSQTVHILQRLRRRIVPLYREHRLSKSSPDFWAARAFSASSFNGSVDRGVFLIYFLNLVNLKPGQGQYLPAGVLHAYLEGACLELMANSDNVLRGGLTRKHVDQDELLRVVRFVSLVPRLLRTSRMTKGEHRYLSPSSDFQLSRINVNREQSYKGSAKGAEIIIAMNSDRGSHTLVADSKRSYKAVRGDAFLVSDGTAYRIETVSSAEFFKACLPLDKKHDEGYS